MEKHAASSARPVAACGSGSRKQTLCIAFNCRLSPDADCRLLGAVFEPLAVGTLICAIHFGMLNSYHGYALSEVDARLGAQAHFRRQQPGGSPAGVGH